MADAVVQFVRNFLCCLKDLDILKGTAITESKTLQKLIALPEPMDQTTPLELLICVTQFFACVSTTRSGIKLIANSLGKLKRVHRLVEIRQEQQQKKIKAVGDAKDKQPEKILTTTDRIVNDSLFAEAQAAVRGITTGLLITPIGICFFWLTINSLHITSVDWFGGLPALIHALEIMEICLFPLLYYMLTDAFAMLARAKGLKTQRNLLQAGTRLREDGLTVDMFKTIAGSVASEWEPFYAQGVNFLSDRKASRKEDEQQLQDEIDKVQSRLDILYPDDKGTLANKHVDGIMVACATGKTKLTFEAYRELIYFVLNFIAFYGYLMGPLCYYYEDHDEEDHELHHSKHPWLVQAMRLWYKNVDADWHGNFAGDLMWTIEPVVILTSPMILSYLVVQGQKSKATPKAKSE